MPRARKKPIEIDYIEFTGDNWYECLLFTGVRQGVNPLHTVPNFAPAKEYWPEHEIPEGITALVWDELHSSWVGVKPGDMIIRGMKGEYYPHDGDLFWKAYDPVGRDDHEN